MRVAGGQLRGRSVSAPAAGDVRPTQDAVREAVFSMLANLLPGCAFLDLFAGSAALPPHLIETAADAIELAWLSHAFDLRLAQALQGMLGPKDRIEEATYARAYRVVGKPRLRGHGWWRRQTLHQSGR